MAGKPPVIMVNVHVHTDSFRCSYCAEPFKQNQHAHKIICPFTDDFAGYWTVCTMCKNDINFHLEGDGEIAGPGKRCPTKNIPVKRVLELLYQ